MGKITKAEGKRAWQTLTAMLKQHREAVQEDVWRRQFAEQACRDIASIGRELQFTGTRR